jgi:DNA-nicking Smr family endonuclease
MAQVLGDPPSADETDDDVVAIPIEDSLDLHAIPPREVKEVVIAYVEEAAARGFREVRLIHGRGQGVQRAIVRKTLAALPQVIDLCDATPDRGGWGATVVRLRAAE